MSWLYVPASADLSSACDSPFPRHEPSATSNGKPITPRSWSRVWRRVAWTKRLSGVTSERSTAARGVASWISSLRGSRASRSASPASGAGKRTSDGSGQISPESFAMWDRVTSSWRIRQASLLQPDLEPYSARWPISGSLRSGACSARKPVELSIGGDGSTSWPTLVAADASRASRRYPRGNPTLMGALLPTLTAQEYGRNTSLGPNARERPSLQQLMRMLPTLTESDAESGPGSQGRDGGINLRTALQQMLPTLTARDHRSGASNITRNSRPLSEVLQRRLPTLTASRRTGLQSHGKNAVLGLINPMWACWFMGFPIGWTRLEPLETASYREWRREHG